LLLRPLPVARPGEVVTVGSVNALESLRATVLVSSYLVPGVKSVTMTTSIPMLNDTIGVVDLAPEGFQFPAGKESVTVVSSDIDEHYFDTMSIALVNGRNFSVNDDENAPKVAIVNQQLAKHYWPNQDPLGKRLRMDKTWLQIVGVAKTSKYILGNAL
jgi:MacB-like periplasmic core domain